MVDVGEVIDLLWFVVLFSSWN